MKEIFQRISGGLTRKIVNLVFVGLLVATNLLLGFLHYDKTGVIYPYWIMIFKESVSSNVMMMLVPSLIASALGAVLSLFAIRSILGHGGRKYYGVYCFNCLVSILIIFLNLHSEFLDTMGLVFNVLTFIVSILGIAYFVLSVKFNREEMFYTPEVEKTEEAIEYEKEVKEELEAREEEKGRKKKSKKQKVIEEVTKAASKKAIEVIKESENEEVSTGEPKDKHKFLIFIYAGVSILLLFSFIFVPIIYSSDTSRMVWGILEFSENKSISSILVVVSVLALTFFGAFRYIYLSLNYKYEDNSTIVDTSKSIFIFNFVFILLASLAGFVATFIQQLMTSGVSFSTYGYIVLVLAAILFVAISIVTSSYKRDIVYYDINDAVRDNAKTLNEAPIKAIKRPVLSREMLVYSILFSLLPIALFFIPLVTVNAEVSGEVKTFIINASTYLVNFGKFENVAENIVSLTIIALIALSAVMLLITITSFAKREKLFYRIAGINVICNFVFITFLSLFGLYFSLSKDAIESIIRQQYLIEELKDITAVSYTYIIFIVASVLLVALLARNPMKHQHIYDEIDNQELFTSLANAKQITEETIGDIVRDSLPEFDENGNLKNPEDSKNLVKQKDPLDVSLVEKGGKKVNLPDFDACPVFTEIDSKEDDFNAALDIRNKYAFPQPSLNALVKFVLSYAANSRLHLSYTFDDIASFVAGLGCSKLTILQGMSGTGKTSLPKIFMEALYGNCELVEIESSWREKNELLGFYNEFSKVYTPKKFTQLLYKAALNPNVVTMIVLDEMNLSRIEYYFSDFLSLMENEPDKRQIKLSNVKLFNIYNNEIHSYKKLTDDHTLKIPSNIWFVGTANRDESTFEISDKVYDRAHTMNFNKRAAAITQFGAPLKPQFMTYEVFNDLLEKAKKSYKFNIEKSTLIKQVEKILAPYNISFGNRIYKQIIEYVAVYCSCYPDPKKAEFDAVESILLTKVVMKLENKNIDRKEQLIAEFAKLKLTKCVDFISKLSEDF